MFPMLYFLIPYGIIAFLGCLFFLFNLLHIAKFGLQCTQTNIVLSAYILSFAGVTILSLLIVAPHDWSTTISFTEIIRNLTGEASTFGL